MEKYGKCNCVDCMIKRSALESGVKQVQLSDGETLDLLEVLLEEMRDDIHNLMEDGKSIPSELTMAYNSALETAKTLAVRTDEKGSVKIDTNEFKNKVLNLIFSKYNELPKGASMRLMLSDLWSEILTIKV